MKSQSYYEILEIPKSATPAEVKKAYHKKALQYHPDKTGGSTTEQFKAIQEANTVLGDPEKRKLYDTIGASGLKMAEKFHFNEEMLSVLTTGAYVLSGMCIALWWLTACLFVFSVNLIIKMDYSESYGDYLLPLRDLRDSSLFAVSNASNLTSEKIASRSGGIKQNQKYWSWSSGVFFPIWASYLALSIFCGLYSYFACRNIFWIVRDGLERNSKRNFCMRSHAQRGKEQGPSAKRREGARASVSAPDDIDGSCDEEWDAQRGTDEQLNGNGVGTSYSASADVKGTARTESTNRGEDEESNSEDDDTTEREGQSNKKRRSVVSSISTIVNALGFILLCVSIIYFSFGIEAFSELRRSLPVFLVKKSLFIQRATSSSSFFAADIPFDNHSNDYWTYFFIFVFSGLGCFFLTTLMKVTPSHVLRKIKLDEARRRNTYDTHKKAHSATRGTKGGYLPKEYYDASVFTEAIFPCPLDVVSTENDSDEEAEEILEQKMGIPRKPMAGLATHYLYCAWLAQNSRGSISSLSSSKSVLQTPIQKYVFSACPQVVKRTFSRLRYCFQFAVTPFYLRYLCSNLWTYICWVFFLVLLKASLAPNENNHRQPFVFLPLYILFSARHLLKHLFLFSAPVRWFVSKGRAQFPFAYSALKRVTSIVGANKAIRSAAVYVSILFFGARAADCLSALGLWRASCDKKGCNLSYGASTSRTSSSAPSSSSEQVYHRDERQSRQRSRNRGEDGHATTSIPIDESDDEPNAVAEVDEDVEKLLDWIRGGGCEADAHSSEKGSGEAAATPTMTKSAMSSFLIELVVRLYTVVCIARILEYDRNWSGHLDGFLAQIFDSSSSSPSLSPLTPAKFDEAMSRLTAATIETERGFLGSVLWFLVGTPGMMRSLLLVLLLNGAVMLPLASCLCCCATAFVTGWGTSFFQKIWEKVEQHAAEMSSS